MNQTDSSLLKKPCQTWNEYSMCIYIYIHLNMRNYTYTVAISYSYHIVCSLGRNKPQKKNWFAWASALWIFSSACVFHALTERPFDIHSPHVRFYKLAAFPSLFEKTTWGHGPWGGDMLVLSRPWSTEVLKDSTIIMGSNYQWKQESWMVFANKTLSQASQHCLLPLSWILQDAHI